VTCDAVITEAGVGAANVGLGGEFSLESHDVYKKYLKIVEKHMEVLTVP
jgi:hypothetical protein